MHTCYFQAQQVYLSCPANLFISDINDNYVLIYGVKKYNALFIL